MNPGMAGQYLFHQSAAGTRHAEQEDGHWRRVACALEAIEQTTVEHLCHAANQLERRLFVINDQPSLQSVTFTQMFKGAGEVSCVFESFCEGGVDEQALF